MLWGQPLHTVKIEMVMTYIQAPDFVVFTHLSGRRGKTDRRIVDEHIVEGFSLLILDSLGGIAGDVEGGIHKIPAAQCAESGTAGHLSTRISWRQRFTAGSYFNSFQDKVLLGCNCFSSGYIPEQAAADQGAKQPPFGRR